MNLNNKKLIAIILTIVIFTSILNFEYSRINNTNKQNVSNYDECYFNQEVLNNLGGKTKNDSNNLQLYRLNNKIISNYLNKYIIGNIYSSTNNYKLKYTAVINEMFSISNSSVFVVLYIHKKDGKKHSYC